MKFKGVPSAGFPFDSSHVALSKIETSKNNSYIKKNFVIFLYLTGTEYDL